MGLRLLLLCLFFFGAPALADSLDDWMELEQTRISRAVNESRIVAPDIKNQVPRFRPEGRGWYPLKAIWVPANELHVALDEKTLDPEVKPFFIRKQNGRTEYRLLIHPESEKFYRELLYKYQVDRTTFRATSTASSRTVLVKAGGRGGPRFFAKLSLDVELGGVRRTVPRTEVARSVGTSRYLEELAERIGRERFAHMPEPYGVSPKGWERGGMILRMIPAEVRESRTKIVPLFSLYAPGEKGRSLLQDLAAKAGKRPADFVAQDILAPFYDGWVRWNLAGAVTMEAHAQNVSLELDRQGLPTGRFVHRDLGGFSIDMQSHQFQPKRALPTFTDPATDYHQAFVGKAREQSLYTYFDGGFLYNIDKELLRIDPEYRPRQVFATARRSLADAIEAQSGVKPSLTKLRSGEGVRSAMEAAQAAFDRENSNGHPTGRCAEGFRALGSR